MSTLDPPRDLPERPAAAHNFGAKQLALLVAVLSVLGVVALRFNLVPVVLAGAVGVAVPSRRPVAVRVAFGAIAALLALLVVRLWPDLDTIQAPSAEPRQLLTWLVGLPLCGAVAILLVPARALAVLRSATMGVMLATFAASLLLLRIDMGRTFHCDQDIVWMASYGIHYHVAVDGVSLWLVLLTTFMAPIATYASLGPVQTRVKAWCFALLLLEAGMLGSFVALDLFVFYIFWELMLVPMFVMIGVWGSTNRVRGALKFFLFTMAGSVLMLGAILYLAYAYSKVSETGTPSFDYFELQRLALPRHVQHWIWLAFTIGFLVKVPMFPLHTWLPDAHTEAPTAGSVLLAAVMLKLGTYGYLRFSMGLFPESCCEYAANLAGLAVLGGILYGALCAWKQADAKRLVAYSSISHLGFVMLGLFALSATSIEGGILQMVNHGISTGMLFLLIGVIYDRRHTRRLEAFGGLAKPMPVFAGLFFVATLASIGLPGTNGFVGEFMVLTGTFTARMLGHFSGVQAVAAAVGVVLGAVYMLMVVEKMFLGPVTHEENKNLPDVNDRELVALAPLAMMVFVIGLFPDLFVSRLKGAAERVSADVEAAYEAHPGPSFYEGPIRLNPLHPEAPTFRPPLPSDTAAQRP
ncbi:MAG: NADH-quinone oxidoreductase subunit M [Polyangiaceae bacterium]|jgi:NADH-quinone oxidoreductase subunit M